MWDLSRPGIEPVSPALAGGLLTTVPPGKSHEIFLSDSNIAEIIDLRPFFFPNKGVYCYLKKQKQKRTMYKLWVEFIQCFTEDCSLGESLSDSSRNCAEEVRGEVSIYVILAKGVGATKHTSQ